MNCNKNSGSESAQLSGWCSSSKIAGRLEGKTRDVLGRKRTADAKYKALETGAEANQWANLEKEVERTGRIIKKLQVELQQEQTIAESLGLGAFCKKAKRRRKHAETALQAAENSLGKVQGRINILKQKQTLGIDRANEILASNSTITSSIKTQIQAVKTKITNYKIERDNIKKAKIAATKTAQTASNMVSINSAKKMNTAGFGSFLSKENLPLIIGGALLFGGVFYFKNKNSQVKKVVA
ncbi:hypothetical protein G1K53_12605 [Tenacibaculum finnmarkense]|uniref:hypothetical protein n=2 Tax=Tenacibaculum finnmarkense TaxID=2781243 RepID=UPI001EFBEC0B|nr:hypothetical protein [Tenacibaculum finnmarkense]MCG8724306.1 hypothetical protein [Tenacibaculum finnmarkense]MCG8742663.1 hypothetical protein [Tenacibaculum finnmarkense]